MADFDYRVTRLWQRPPAFVSDFGAPLLLGRHANLGRWPAVPKEDRLQELLGLIGAALSLDRSAAPIGHVTPDLMRTALLVAFLGGVSLTLGQSAVLFANQVTPRRFVLLLFGGALTYVFGLVVWGVTIWLAASYGLRHAVSLEMVIFAVCLGQAPMLFGMLVLLPYMGTGIHRLLDVYSLLVVVVALSTLMGVRLWEALLAAGAGWALRALLTTLLERPLGGVQLWLWRAASGQATRIDLADALPELAVRPPTDRARGGRP
jgi:hypothetical protein